MNEKSEQIQMEGAVRQRLLASALHLFTRKGYAATTVREIVMDASVTKPVLYYHFGNKEAIYLDLFRETYARFDALLEEALYGEGDGREKLSRLVDEIMALTEANIELVRLMYAVYYGPPQGAPFFDFDVYHRKLHETLQELVQGAIGPGETTPALTNDVVWAVLGAIDVAVGTMLSHQDLRIGREEVVRIIDLIFEGVAARKWEMQEKSR
jgi:TetR/AcrR family transcriptional regulator